MARRGPKVDEGMSIFRSQECRDIGLADLHLKRGSYAVQRLELLAFRIQVVLVQINESWSNDQGFGRDHALAVKSFSRDFLDLALADADIANRIKTCFRIDYPTTLNNKIVAL